MSATSSAPEAAPAEAVSSRLRVSEIFHSITCLCDAGYEVFLETSGALDISRFDPRVRRAMDLKGADSGEPARNLWSNLDHLTPRDQVKFVLVDRADYDWPRTRMCGPAPRTKDGCLLKQPR